MCFSVCSVRSVVVLCVEGGPCSFHRNIHFLFVVVVGWFLVYQYVQQHRSIHSLQLHAQNPQNQIPVLLLLHDSFVPINPTSGFWV